MRVLIINTSEKTGGAAVAANRLMEALNNNGVKAKMLVRDKETANITVVGLSHPMLQHWHFLWERWCIYLRLHCSRKHLFDIDIANAGADVTSLPEFKEADVIHLSWINQGMLSLGGIRKIIASGKPVVWTMHDLWPATAICHYAHGCPSFKTVCHSCKLLPGGGSDKDLSTRVWNRKKRIYADSNIHFVTCSRWLEGQAKQSGLFVGQRVMNIPNPIDTRLFCKKDRREARLSCGLPVDKNVILFVSQRVTDGRKGMDYFVDALEKLVAAHPETRENTCVAILGGHSEEISGRLALPVYPLGYVNDTKKIVDVYNSANVFVLPSLEDNLPNTIMESMACGVPCVGFKVGGIPEMIDHQRNGYVASFKDADDLANGIHWVLVEACYDALSNAAIRKVVTTYSQHTVAMKYIEVYNQASAFKNYRL
jgi:glycosyltransferase involved in cell wall biosynthesis